MSECKCESRIRILGDGCRYCQPQTYIELMERCHAEKLAEDEALLKQALEALETPIHEQPLGMRQNAIAALRERLGEKE